MTVQTIVERAAQSVSDAEVDAAAELIEKHIRAACPAVKSLRDALAASEAMFDRGESSAFIVGYLQEVIKGALASSAYLRDETVHAAMSVRALWGLGFVSADPSLSEPPAR